MDGKINPAEWVAALMAIGTWLFVMHQQYHGIHYVPDEWILGIILSPYGGRIYSLVREGIKGKLQQLPKKD